MRFVSEDQVPERMRLVRPAPNEPVSNVTNRQMQMILDKLTQLLALERQESQESPVDLKPILEAIRAIPAAPKAKEPVNKWTFTIVRNEDGFISEVTAERGI